MCILSGAHEERAVQQELPGHSVSEQLSRLSRELAFHTYIDVSMGKHNLVFLSTLPILEHSSLTPQAHTAWKRSW